MNTWLTLFLLQLQCGSQQWGDVNLRYGTAIVIETNQERAIPKILRFQDYSTENENHPWCLTLSKAFDQEEGTIKVLVSPENDIVCVDRC